MVEVERHERARAHMVDAHLARRGIADPRVLEAFRRVPREAFVPPELVEFAYDDTPLPIGDGQTISQPYIVALTVEALGLRGGERVLEIGTGSGYAAAILSRLAGEVYTVERHRGARAIGRASGSRASASPTCTCSHGDGSLGWPEHAPYDAIAVAAGGPEGASGAPRAARRSAGGSSSRSARTRSPSSSCASRARARRRIERRSSARVRFVPLIGEQGWPAGGTPRVTAPPARLTRALATRPRSSRSCARRPSRSTTSTRRASMRSSIASATRASSCSARRRTARASSTGCARASRASSSRAAASSSSPSRPTGPTPRASTTTCSAASAARRSTSRPSTASRPGCGATRRSTSSSTGCARTTPTSARTRSASTVSTSTACSRRSRPCSRTSTRSTRTRRASRATRYGALTPWQKDPAAYGQAVLVGRYESSEPAVVAMLRDMLAEAESTTREGRRALLRRRPERARRRERRALLPQHVLRLGDVVEPARSAHVRHAPGRSSASTARRLEGDRLGAQLARRRRLRRPR